MPLAPTHKITAAAVGGAIAIIAAWVLTVTTSVEPPAPVVAALTTLCTLAAGYFVPEGE